MPDLRRDGYFLVPRVIDAETVKRLRVVCEEYHDRTGNDVMPLTDFLAIPELMKLPFLPKVVSALKMQLGDEYVTFPEFTMQTDRFGGWHTDSGNQGIVDYVYRPDWMQVQCAIYLQDNDPEHGGGLDVKPGGHREMLSMLDAGNPLRKLARRASHKFRRSHSIPSRAGDLLGFHFRLLHRATPRSDPSRRKFAIFWVAASNTPDVARYMEHLKTYEGGLPSFEYPETARESAKGHGTVLATPP